QGAFLRKQSRLSRDAMVDLVDRLQIARRGAALWLVRAGLSIFFAQFRQLRTNVEVPFVGRLCKIVQGVAACHLGVEIQLSVRVFFVRSLVVFILSLPVAGHFVFAGQLVLKRIRGRVVVWSREGCKLDL